MTADAAAIMGAVFGSGFAVVALAMALRNGALRESVARLEAELDKATHAATLLEAELDREREAAADILTRRREDTERLYDELQSGDDRDVGARARRGIQRLLSAYGADR